MLNDPTLRQKYLDPEHKGVKVLVLFTHPPGQVHSARKPIMTLADLKGQRVRFPSPPVRDFLEALGATPVGVAPTEMVEQLQKGAIDARTRANQVWKALLAEAVTPPLDPGIDEALSAYVARRKAEGGAPMN